MGVHLRAVDGRYKAYDITRLRVLDLVDETSIRLDLHILQLFCLDCIPRELHSYRSPRHENEVYWRQRHSRRDNNHHGDCHAN